MPNLHDIERRINSVSSTKQITRTMQMVAAAKIRRANERVIAATPYSESMVEMLANVAKRVGGSENALLRTHDEVRNVLIVVVASDRGLAGGFNSNVLRQVDRLMKQKRDSGAEVSIVACGKKPIGYYTYRKIEPVLRFAGLSADPTVDEAAAIAAYAIDGYGKGTIDEVFVVYNHAKNAAEQQLRTEQVLPVDTAALLAASEQDEGAAQKLEGDVIFEPSASAVLDQLLPAYVRTTLYHALIDSAAAEQGARRNAMMSATDNATEMVDDAAPDCITAYAKALSRPRFRRSVGGAAALED